VSTTPTATPTGDGDRLETARPATDLAGHEQAGRRPALVLSPLNYHEKTALAVVCPITSNVAPYPFKVLLPEGLPIGGAVFADQVKSIDRAARQLKVAGPAPRSVVVEVQAKIAALLSPDDA
jgi:mRNA interferase MazF